MSVRQTRVEGANTIFDQFPISEYPPELRVRLGADLKVIRAKLAISIELIMSQESHQITGHVQMLLAELRIDVENLEDLVT